MMKKMLGKLQTGILLILAAGTPVVAVLDERFWFEKRVALAGAAVVLLGLWASRTWRIGRIGRVSRIGPMGLFAASLLVAAAVPAGRIANLMSPNLWAALGAIVAYFAIKNTLTSSKQIKWGFVAASVGIAAAVAATAAGIGRIGPIGPIREQATATLEILQRSPIFGEFREFRVGRVINANAFKRDSSRLSAKGGYHVMGILQTASGLGILGILGTLALVYQIGLKSVKEIFKSSSIWWKVLNILVLVLLAGFLVLPHPALMLWPLAIAAALAEGIGQIGPISPIGPIRKVLWAIFVGLLIITVLGSSYGLGRVVWGELKFREALAAANRNEGIATYYALRESIRRNPYEVRYRLLASQINIALANSIATPSARLTAQDQNNILILIQQAVVEGKKAVQLDPENSALWQNLASIYRGLVGVAGGAEDWALKSYQRAAELNSQDPNPWLQIGEIHFVGGNFDGATEAFKEAIRIDPHFTRAHYDLAVAYNALNEVDKAIEELRETLALLPADDPSREQVERDLKFLKGEKEPGSDESGLSSPPSELSPGELGSETEDLKEATSSAEVESPPPPVGPPDLPSARGGSEADSATESAEPEKVELGE